MLFRTEGFDIITEMLRQILTVHDKATHIHIGKYSSFAVYIILIYNLIKYNFI